MLKLTELLAADIYRDGGSYQATFTTEDGATLTLALRISGRGEGQRAYGGLFECALDEASGATPIATGSQREQEILAALRDWVERNIHGAVARGSKGQRLLEMVEEIPRRAPAWPIGSPS